jgi:hypothetical protein
MPRRIMILLGADAPPADLEPTVRALVARGRHVELAFAAKALPASAEALAEELELVTVSRAQTRRDDWAPLVLAISDRRRNAALAWAERAIPTNAWIDDVVHGRFPDVLVVAAPAPALADWAISARRAGVRTARMEPDAEAIEALLAQPWPSPERPHRAEQAARPLLWLVACSPLMPKVKGLQRTPHGRRTASLLGASAGVLRRGRARIGAVRR